jgi:hypothetical protein
MSALWRQVVVAIRLHFRNRMAVIYNYLFPTMFLIAFWALYRYERVPLQAHMGELLTVTVLGGACFGLPTTMVSERERGVWRRYRLMPASLTAIVASTLAARYLLLVLAGLLQLALAVAIGMPLPERPLDLLVAFTCAAIAFMGLGLVIAMIADTVPAVQALGQSVFLPMLIVGGVAVPLARLPAWAQTLSSFLPGRYAVEAIQTSVHGPGLAASGFSVAALLIIGVAACAAASRLFRWDPQDRLLARGGVGWVSVAILPWIAIGALAESRPRPAADSTLNLADLAGPAPAPPPPALLTPTPTETERARGAEASRRVVAAPATLPSDVRAEPAAPPSAPPVAPDLSEGGVPAPLAPLTEAVPAAPQRWMDVTRARIDRDIVFDRLPPDDGIVTPLARPGEAVDPSATSHLVEIERELDGWTPGRIADTEQRARNLLYLPGVIDLLQLPAEPYVPRLVFAKLQREIPRDDLEKVLYWIAVHWASGNASAIREMTAFGIDVPPEMVDQVRNRASVYAVKLLGRMTGAIPD